MDKHMEGPKKLKIELSYDLPVLLVGMYPEEFQKDVYTPVFI